jgi:hypothetical protein
MTKRGKILRDTSLGAGLLVVDGQQYSFPLEGVWKSDVPPAVGMTVDVDLDAAGQVTSVRGVSDSQIAKAQAEAALAAAKSQGTALVSSMTARFGAANLIAAALLLIGWLFLSAVSIKTPIGSISYTFWQLLGFVNAKSAFELMLQAGQSGSGAGIYGLLAVIAIVGPFIHYFWKDKRAMLGGLLPLLFMLLVGLMAHSGFNHAIGAPGGDPNDPYVQQLRDEMAKAISIGFGVYLSVLASIYFAAMSVKNFMAANAGGTAKA